MTVHVHTHLTQHILASFPVIHSAVVRKYVGYNRVIIVDHTGKTEGLQEHPELHRLQIKDVPTVRPQLDQ